MTTTNRASELHSSLLGQLKRSGSVGIDGMIASFVESDPESEVADATTKTFVTDKKGNPISG